MIRLIVSDLDGTLVQGANVIHPANLEALRAAMARGVRFAVASGRTAPACSILMRDHGLDDAFIIATNGCEIMDRPFGRLLEIHHLSREAAAETARITRRHGLWTCLCSDDALIYDPKEMLDRELDFHKHDDFIARMEAAGCHVLHGTEAMDTALRADKTLKLYAIHTPDQVEAFVAAREACARIPGASVTSSWHTNFEIMPEGVDKGSAVRALAARLGLDRSEVMAFGDNENDLSMLTWAGHGCAMGNAKAPIREAVGRVTGHCHEGGVAQAIQKYVLDVR